MVGGAGAFVGAPSLLTAVSHRRPPLTPRKRRRHQAGGCRPVHATQTAPTPLQADRPKWAGGGPISDFVNFLINTPPIYAVMKFGARQVIINTAEKNGVPWKGKIAELEAAFPGDEFQSAVDAITDPKLEYPPYYLVKFHAYDEGNLHFLAAAEAGSATLSMCLRVWPDEVMTPVVAQARLRASHLNAVLAAAPADWLQRPDFVAVDAGCSIGMSTQAVVDFLRARRPGLPDASVIGLDAGPQMLVVAARDADCGAKYVHGLAEDSKLADDSVDWFGLQFVVHECPAEATRAIFAEALRVLRPGGVLSMIDNDPTSPVIKGRPPAIATLLKATEPHSDSYYALDVEELMRVVGFATASSVRSDPRHHTVVGVKG